MAETNQWICPTCSTKIFNLDKCWNCHTYRPGVQPPATEALKAEDAEELSTALLLDGSEPSDPSTQDIKSMLIRYQDGYRVAKVIQGFGEGCKVLGIVLGVL